jgi:hypothetical protein
MKRKKVKVSGATFLRAVEASYGKLDRFRLNWDQCVTGDGIGWEDRYLRAIYPIGETETGVAFEVVEEEPDDPNRYREEMCARIEEQLRISPQLGPVPDDGRFVLTGIYTSWGWIKDGSLEAEAQIVLDYCLFQTGYIDVDYEVGQSDPEEWVESE